MRYCVPGHWQEEGLEIVFDLQRLYQTGICPFPNAVVRPEEDIGTLAALGSSLELLSDLFLGFYFDWNSNVLFENFTEVTQGVICPVIAYPD